jgi:hypothetical protein
MTRRAELLDPGQQGSQRCPPPSLALMKLARKFVQGGAALCGAQQRDAIPLSVGKAPDQVPGEV